MLLKSLQSTIVCDNSLDGVCTLPSPCQYYSQFSDYTFLLNFTNSSIGNGYYMRVPLATFASTVVLSNGT